MVLLQIFFTVVTDYCTVVTDICTVVTDIYTVVTDLLIVGSDFSTIVTDFWTILILFRHNDVTLQSCEIANANLTHCELRFGKTVRAVLTH